MKYTAINIGPIFETILMARKPRELWSASFLFSYLMQCLIDAVPNKDMIVSPGNIPTEKNGVGLCPDRLFIKGECDVNCIRESALKTFSEGTKLNNDTIEHYFKIMSTSLDANSDQEAIKALNAELDKIELFETVNDGATLREISKLLRNNSNSPLYNLAFENGKNPVETLGEIAAYSLSGCEKWHDFEKVIKSDNDKNAFNQLPKDLVKSYHKYICVVQADGDNMGKIVSGSDKVKEISQCLIEFGKNATNAIKKFGGMPIYAGGDDLLFISPVISNNNNNIFDLIDILDGLYNNVQEKANLKDIKTSMSYGISISYYKYPLYESLSEARLLLFDKAKSYKQKNAIAWNLHKHAGSSFYGVVGKDSPTFSAFKKAIEASTESDSLVAAVAHKIRANEGMINLWINDKEHLEERNLAFFKKFIEYTGEEEIYKTCIMNLLNEICKEEPELKQEPKSNISEWSKKVYGMIRTAKFIRGEEVKE